MQPAANKRKLLAGRCQLEHRGKVLCDYLVSAIIAEAQLSYLAEFPLKKGEIYCYLFKWEGYLIMSPKGLSRNKLLDFRIASSVLCDM